MTKAVSNVVIATDTFQTVVERVNTLASAMTSEAMTVLGSTAGANTNGNGSVIGIFSANVLATPLLRGGAAGNTATLQGLTIGFSNATNSSNVTIVGHYTNVTSNNILLSSDNTIIAASNLVINYASARLTGNATFAVNTSFNALALTGNSTAVNFTANSNTFNINTTLLTLTGSANITSSANIGGSLNVVGESYFGNSITFDGIGSLVANTVQLTFANNDAQLIDAIDVSVYQTAKYTIQVQSSTANEVSMTEISLVYGFSNVFTTEYGTVYANSQLVSFTANSNTTHARLYSATVDYTFANNLTYKLIRTTLK
jgi:hypothetical protein